jgi:hypothetical protein
MDGFNWIAAGTTPASSPTLNALLEEKYDSNTNVVDADADLLSSPGPANTLQFGNSTNDRIRIDLGTGYTTLFLTFKSRLYESDRSGNWITFTSTTGNDQGGIGYSPSFGGFRAYRLGSTVVQSFNLTQFTPGEELQWEIKFVNANAPTGEIVIKVNGETIVNATGIDTYNFGSGVDRIDIYCNSSGTGETETIRDLIINDDVGSIANTWVGQDKHVYGLIPDGDGNYSQWTRSTGAVDYTLIDEVSRDSTDYIEESTTTNKTSVTLGATGSETNILAVQAQSNALLSAAGSETFREIMRHSTTDGNGTTHTVTSTSEAHFFSIFETNPSTTSQWTAAELDAAEVGVEYV